MVILKAKNIAVSTFGALMAASLILIGCSKSGDNGGGGTPAGLNALSDEQQQRFDKTADNVSKVTDWKSDSKSLTLLAAPQSIDSSRPAIPSPGDNVKDDLDKSVNAKCQFEMIQPDPQTAPPKNGPWVQEIKSGMNITGSTCPIDFSYLSYQKQTSDFSAGTVDGVINLELKYIPREDSAKALDIQSLKFKIDGTISVSQAVVTGNIQGDGAIVSSSQGQLILKFSTIVAGTGSEYVSTSMARLTYPDGLTVELKQVSTHKESSEQNTYFLNNKPIDEKTYKTYSTKFGLEKEQS
jgi:hypothetical protein